MTVAPSPSLASNVLDDVRAALQEHYFDLYAIEHEADVEGDGLMVIWTTVEEAHIDRFLIFDLSKRNLPDDWQEHHMDTGPSSPAADWSARMAEVYNNALWHEDQHRDLLDAAQGVLARHGDVRAVDVAYFPLVGPQVLERLLMMRERYRSRQDVPVAQEDARDSSQPGF